MQEVVRILRALEENGISISVDRGDLVLHLGETGLSPSMKASIRRHKHDIISHLNGERHGRPTDATGRGRHNPVPRSRSAVGIPPRSRSSGIGIDCHQPVAVYFENQCHASPESTALEFNGHSVDYHALNRRADDIARHLLTYGVCPGDIVAVFLDRSVDMVASLLAIFKIGAIYLPIDPEYPKERILYVREDSDAKAIVVQEHMEKNLPGVYATVIRIDSTMVLEDRIVAGSDITLEDCSPSIGDSAYMIYTSGSTGAPKGVEIGHGSLTNIMIQVIDELALSASDTFLAIASISFDISLFELIAPLMIGGKVILLDSYHAKDPSRIADTVKKRNVTVLQATPAMWTLLNHYDWDVPSRRIKAISTGEALSRQLAREISERNGVLWNLYGPTETSIWATGKRIQEKTEAIGSGPYTPIGYPLKGYTTHVLDRLRQPVPIGVLGELYIGGTGLAKGYVGENSLTEERFVEHRFSDGRTERLYRTGDLVRVLENSEIEYVRRMDNQVKINGYRIELGEIEAVLKGHISVRDAVAKTVEVTKSGINLIVAYVVPERDMPNKTSETLTRHLSQYLPSYMLPHRYMFLDKVPLSGSGKVDRSALPIPGVDSESEYVEPRDETEAELSEIFCDVLEIERIGIYDNFFDMGGSSMLAATLLIPINDAYDLDISLREILRVPPTVSNVASLVREKGMNQTAKPTSRMGGYDEE